MESRPIFGGASPTPKESREPFFSGWQESSSTISGRSGGLQAPYSPSPEPSPRTVLPIQAEEKREGSILLEGDHHGLGLTSTTAAQPVLGEPSVVGGPVDDNSGSLRSHVRAPSNPPFLFPSSRQGSSSLPPALLRRVSNNPDESSSGAEISDASSFAHMLTRRELSKRSFKRLMTGPNHLAAAPTTAAAHKPVASAPTILMEFSSPVPRIEKPALVRSLTFSEALRDVSDLQAPSPISDSSLAPLPMMPPRPRFARSGRSSNESPMRSVSRSAGRRPNARMQNRSTASSNQSLKPPSIQRTISTESGGESDRPPLARQPSSIQRTISTESGGGSDKPQLARNHVSFGSLRDPEQAISPGHGRPSPVPAASVDMRRASFPWNTPARPADGDRRSTFPMEKEQVKRPSLLARLMSTFSRARTASPNVVPSARSAVSRRMSADREKRNSGKPFPLPPMDTSGQSCVRKMSNLFVRRPPPLKVENSPILSPFTHDARSYMPFSSPDLSTSAQEKAERRERSSISYRDSHGRHYVMAQKVGKRATWLPSEMTRINTPPLRDDGDGRGLGKSRGFFFDMRKPPGDDDDSVTIRKQAKTRSWPAVLSSTSLPGPSLTLQTKQRSNPVNAGATQNPSRGTLLQRTMRRFHTNALNGEDTPATSTESYYLGAPDYFRQRLNLTADSPKDEDVEYAWDVPEHLPNSPLCPKNAAMYGLALAALPGQGRKACPMHERKRSAKVDSKDVVLGRPDRTRVRPRKDEWEDL